MTVRQCISIGASVGAVAALLTPVSYGLQYDYQAGGEAWAWVGGVTLDWVAIPPGPEGQAAVATPRVGNMALLALGVWAAVVALGGATGAGLGLAWGRWRQRRAELGAVAGGGGTTAPPDPASGAPRFD